MPERRHIGPTLDDELRVRGESVHVWPQGEQRVALTRWNCAAAGEVCRQTVSGNAQTKSSCEYHLRQCRRRCRLGLDPDPRFSVERLVARVEQVKVEMDPGSCGDLHTDAGGKIER